MLDHGSPQWRALMLEPSTSQDLQGPSTTAYSRVPAVTEDGRPLRLSRHFDQLAVVVEGLQVLDDCVKRRLVHAQSYVRGVLLSR